MIAASIWAEVGLAAVAPAVTFLLGFGVAELVARRVQRRRQQGETRDSLAAEMYDVAGLLYFELQGFWRLAKSVNIAQRRTDESLAELVTDLDRSYSEARRRGKIVEQRLLIYFDAREPALRWHRVMDLLSVRYFLLLEGDEGSRATYRMKNAGPYHTGLTAEQLNDPSVVLESYRVALPEAVAALWQHDVDWEGRHIKSRGDVATWALALGESAEEVPPRE